MKSSHQTMNIIILIRWILHRNQYIQPPNRLATMVSETVPIGTDSFKEPPINSTRMLTITTANRAGVMNLIIDAELKQNSTLFIHDIWSSTSPSREVFWETLLFNHHGQGEQTWFFLCLGNHYITEWVHQIPTLCQHVLFPTSALEGRYSHNG